MQELFNIVARTLRGISTVTGLSYNEINIVVYYLIIPMIFFIMIDRIMKKHILKVSLLVIAVLVPITADFNEFSNWLFDASVKFLNMFEVLGWNYTVSSVIICVFIPIVLFMVLFYFSYWPDFKRYFITKTDRKTYMG